MPESKNYQSDHCIAKAVICILYITAGVISIETGNPYIALYIGTVVWFFGVNTTAYIIEAVLKHPHCHNKF